MNQQLTDAFANVAGDAIRGILALLPYLLPIAAVCMGITLVLALGWRIIRWIGGG